MARIKSLGSFLALFVLALVILHAQDTSTIFFSGWDYNKGSNTSKNLEEPLLCVTGCATGA